MQPSSLTETADTGAKAKALRLLASDIRALRKARGLTLSRLAEKLGRSVGWLSQVERGISLPSLSDLRALANQFSVPVSLFFAQAGDDDSEHEVIVRAENRRLIAGGDAGVVEELLSPDLCGSFAIIRTEFAPGRELAEPAQRQTEEAGFVISGQFEIEIAGIWHRLSPGDSYCVRRKPFRWRNPGTETAVVLQVMSPPVT
ncbi:XRE family transcriptional regulator [Mesorhizobium sp. J18]|uniref:helix-turn-helix domain-containing protein n=1 Tax=Mesorhizobium sp. J18 TaxID=935263 RepID=UPI00119983F2|nr:XRE family transcriptional regulator [Mesorhizobium sp. J18]TWH01125.1 XRE family transcriptional regulator [Mesorhizobium sp. J18]